MTVEIFLDLVNQILQMSTNSSSQVNGLKIVNSTTISLNLKEYQMLGKFRENVRI
jgi:hypothetical protein